MRLYQALAMGRIPVLSVQDMILSFQEEGCPWLDVCVLATNPEEIPAALSTFKRRTPDLEAAQWCCREMFDAFLSPKALGRRLQEVVLAPNASV